jgi:hypothetical protein
MNEIAKMPSSYDEIGKIRPENDWGDRLNFQNDF